MCKKCKLNKRNKFCKKNKIKLVVGKVQCPKKCKTCDKKCKMLKIEYKHCGKIKEKINLSRFEYKGVIVF